MEFDYSFCTAGTKLPKERYRSEAQVLRAAVLTWSGSNFCKSLTEILFNFLLRTYIEATHAHLHTPVHVQLNIYENQIF